MEKRRENQQVKGKCYIMSREKSYSRFEFDETRCERTVSSVRARSISIFYAKGRI